MNEIKGRKYTFNKEELLSRPKHKGKGGHMYTFRSRFGDVKRCYKCQLYKTVGEFGIARQRADGLNNICKSCKSFAASAYHQRVKLEGGYSKKRIRQNLASKLKTKFGLEIDRYEEMLETQAGLCAICCETCISGKRLSVDHNHSSGAVRGLLCARCNFGLGYFRDRPDLLESAIEYLKLHSHKPI